MKIRKSLHLIETEKKNKKIRQNRLDKALKNAKKITKEKN
ncbi:hypothetical protein ABMB67_001706 [Halalkalibacter oceani]